MTDVSSNAGSPDDSGKHEPDTVSVRGMALIGMGLLLLVVLTISGVALAFKVLVPDSPLVTSSQQSRRESMIPGVKPNQAYDRQRIEAAERAMLSHYQWQDKTHRFVRIPIERSIELMAQHALRVEWPKNETDETQVPAVESPEKELK